MAREVRRGIANPFYAGSNPVGPSNSHGHRMSAGLQNRAYWVRFLGGWPNNAGLAQRQSIWFPTRGSRFRNSHSAPKIMMVYPQRGGGTTLATMAIQLYGNPARCVYIIDIIGLTGPNILPTGSLLNIIAIMYMGFDSPYHQHLIVKPGDCARLLMERDLTRRVISPLGVKWHQIIIKNYL